VGGGVLVGGNMYTTRQVTIYAVIRLWFNLSYTSKIKHGRPFTICLKSDILLPSCRHEVVKRIIDSN